ncbi:MAG TPA: hypothetical protein VGG88_01650 [Gaiellaceae bacterium]
MSSLASPRGALRSVTLSDRLAAALPLTAVYVWLCGLYALEAWQRVTPWLFTDELEFTQLARSIAKTGHAAERGQHHSPDSIYNYLTAIFWQIHDVSAAYSAIKYVDVLVMASVLFPTYFLARMLVGRTAALFAAAGAAAIPAMAYSSYLVEETLAYPYAALCFFLITKAFVLRRGGRRWAVAAVIACLLAPLVRGELVVIPIVLVLALLFAWWSGEGARAWRRTWSPGDWVGAVALFFGAVFFLSGILSHQSTDWHIVSRVYKHRILIEGDWAAGALAIGMGVLPFVAGLASLFRAPGEERSHELRMFRCVALAGIVSFGFYTGFKAAYLSAVFATRVEERNLIYIAPLLFVGTALVFSRRRVSFIGLGLAGAYGLYLVGYALYHVTQYPYQMGIQLYSDALGFAILQQGNRFLSWTPTFARWLLVAIALGTVLVLLAPRLLRGRERLTGIVLAVAAVLVVGWNLTAELAAATGTKSVARGAAATLGHPFGWVDDATHLKPTLYMGEAEIDQNPEWLLEFWNRSISRVSSLDASVLGPGPSGSPNVKLNGVLYWQNDPNAPTPQYAYAVEDLPCIDFAGTKVTTHQYRAGGGHETWELVQLASPNRFQSTCNGIYADGWTRPGGSSYFRFHSSPGWLRIVYSRADWGYKSGPTPVRIVLHKVVTRDQEPALGPVVKRIETSVDSTQTKVAWLRVPAGTFAVHVAAARSVIPANWNPSSSDRRKLGVELSYRFVLTRPSR